MKDNLTLESIEISDFRGFPEAQTFQLYGQHLLLYGENGSGKTSIFKAIEQLLLLSSDAPPYNNELSDIRCLKNRFTDEKRADGHITLGFHVKKGDPAIGDLTWQINGDRPVTHPLFNSMARTRGCLDYRAVLRTNFLHESDDGINLFRLSVETLLRDIEMPNSLVAFGDEWNEIKTAGEELMTERMVDPVDLDDLQLQAYGFDVQSDVEDAEFDEAEYVRSKEEFWREYMELRHRQLRERVSTFNSGLASRLAEIEDTANKFIRKFDETLKISFNYEVEVNFPSGLDEQWTERPRLWLKTNYRGEHLDHPALLLNEARLSAIAIVIYLAALKIETPTSAGYSVSFPRLVVLDDVLIGLDMGNRLPVLELIQTDFVNQGWQVFLMTFDRAWYELAKQRLPNGKWKFLELYSVRLKDYEKPIVLDDQDHLDRALNFLLEGEVKAAAAHVRTELELTLKRACEEFPILVKYHSNPAKIPASALWTALVSSTFEFQPASRWVRKGRGFIDEPSPRQKVPYLQKDLVTRIEHSVSWVLNRLVHADFENRYSPEIEAAIFDVDLLRRHLQEISNGTFKQLSRERELLLRVVMYRKGQEAEKTDRRKQLKKAAKLGRRVVLKVKQCLRDIT
jgi:energy-coupling factor transporter ATP-binding protein EcfA2